MVPAGDTLHETVLSVALVTAAVNCCVAPRIVFAVPGEAVIATAGIEIVAEAVLLVSAWEVAVTVTDAGVVADAGAEYRPVDETVPRPVTVHATAVFAVPITVAVNCWVAPTITLELVGETLILTT